MIQHILSMDFKKWFKWDTGANKIESISFILLIIAAVFTALGVSIGSFIPGIPVAMAIMGAALVVVSIVLYVISEFIRILSKKK